VSTSSIRRAAGSRVPERLLERVLYDPRRGPRPRADRARRDCPLYRDRGVWTDVIRTNVLFNFVQQLKHVVGVLAPETRSHSGAIAEYDPDTKPWIVADTE